jgi:hypothetical protein
MTLFKVLGVAHSQMVGIKGGADVGKVHKAEAENLALDPSALRREHTYQQTLDGRPQPHQGFRNLGTLLVVSEGRETTVEEPGPHTRRLHASRIDRLRPGPPSALHYPQSGYPVLWIGRRDQELLRATESGRAEPLVSER